MPRILCNLCQTLIWYQQLQIRHQHKFTCTGISFMVRINALTKWPNYSQNSFFFSQCSMRLYECKHSWCMASFQTYKAVIECKQTFYFFQFNLCVCIHRHKYFNFFTNQSLDCDRWIGDKIISKIKIKKSWYLFWEDHFNILQD